ncbi:MAG TPA: VWA domain-containing protein [Phycisphaerales bacterium]|nr:VWA domain-containing protein [Phycisphaerales bacterium]HMP36349.1 VWA domain-containing protein [Phycisphaerales bacterium]
MVIFAETDAWAGFGSGAALSLGVAAVAIVAAAEWLHARRITRVARLAFAGAPAPPRWARAIAPLRVIAAGLAAWGLAYLSGFDAGGPQGPPSRAASQHLLVCLDVSPSMTLKDAGPEPEKMARSQWAGRLIQGVLDRLDAATTRVTLVVFYTEARPIVQETFDKEVIRNALDGLPMFVAFEPGPTDLHAGIVKAFEIAKPWPARSATLLVVSDGDAAPKPPPAMPVSIADAIVVGVGDPTRPTAISGHSSRQDSGSLKLLATRLGGHYHDGNRHHLPSSILAGLSMTTPHRTAGLSLRDLALAAVGVGCGILAFAGPALQLGVRPAGQPRRGGAPSGRLDPARAGRGGNRFLARLADLGAIARQRIGRAFGSPPASRSPD